MNLTANNIPKFPYKRVFIKLSGESLSSGFEANTSKNHKSNYFDSQRIKKTVGLIKKSQQAGLQVAVMSGGGNIIRGSEIEGIDISKPAKDQIGMLSTVMNSLVLYEMLKKENCSVKVLSSLSVEGIFESFSPIKAKQYLSEGHILILAGGSGKPVFTTDTASVVLAIECGCDAIFKLTKVDGIYSKNPSEPDAQFFKTLSIKKAISKNLKVMDLTAFTLSQENKIPIHICNMDNENSVIENSNSHLSGSLIYPDNC